MGIQTATTGNLEDAQRIAIAACRFTMEHTAPCVSLIEHMTLRQGEKQATVPKVGQATASDLTDGVDIVDSEDIGMTTTDLTTAEVGLKFILTDKLLRQNNEDSFKIVGRQMGDAMGRKKDRDVIALFSALNGGTPLGADDKEMTMTNFSACIARMKGAKCPSPFAAVHHPNAVYQLMKSVAVTPSASYPIPHGYAEDLLKDFYNIKVSGVAVFEDGNIDVISGVASGYGAIFSKAAMVILESVGFQTKTQEDISLRATEIVVLADYGCFELDDSYGFPLQYEIGNPATDAA